MPLDIVGFIMFPGVLRLFFGIFGAERNFLAKLGEPGGPDRVSLEIAVRRASSLNSNLKI